MVNDGTMDESRASFIYLKTDTPLERTHDAVASGTIPPQPGGKDRESTRGKTGWNEPQRIWSREHAETDK